MGDADPDPDAVIAILEHSPERATAVRGYSYRVASVRLTSSSTSVDINRMRGLWEHLSSSVGWTGLNNHSVFVFELDGLRHSVLFTDFTARFGREEDVFEKAGQ